MSDSSAMENAAKQRVSRVFWSKIRRSGVDVGHINQFAQSAEDVVLDIAYVDDTHDLRLIRA
jgi:ribosomal protein L18E